MFGLPLAFMIPAMLAALAALPVLYWLLRLTPPPPSTAVLPTLAIVRDMERKDETPAHTPWWLLLLRLLVAALVILAMAGPLWNPDTDARAGRGPLLVVMDNSWSAAPDWQSRAERAQALIETAGGAGRPVALRATSDDPVDIVPGSAARVLDQLRGLSPVPYSVDRKRHEASILAFLERQPEGSLIWITDLVSALDDRDALATVAARAGDRMVTLAPGHPAALALAGPANTPEAMNVRVLRATDAALAAGTLRATDVRGRAIAEARFQFPPSAREVTARFETPLEIRNDISRIDIVEQASSGAVQLLDGRNKRRRVGVISGESPDTAQPLLSPSYFVTRALGPFADVREAQRGSADPYVRLLEDGVGVLVLTDVGALSGATLNRLQEFVENGGVLIRFASRRVAAPTDALMPVRLRRNERVMGGALSWDTPKKLASFAASGPFDGMRVPDDVTVSQQILAEPDAALSDKTWAALEDGTPLITGERRGKGVIALFHVTADSGWSSLPLSLAFVETLRRLTGLSAIGGEAQEVGSAADASRRDEALLAPLRNLDAFGVFRSPAPTAEPVRRNHQEPASARHPPGFYGAAESPLSVNVMAANAELLPIDTAGLTVRPLLARQALDLRPHLLTLALLLFFVDALLSLWLSGAFARLRLRSAAAALAAGVALAAIGSPSPAEAQTAAPAPPAAARPDRIPSFRADDIEAALTTRLAYVITGDREVDEISRQGLQGLTRALASRTALEPGEPIGVDLARDELVFYPLLYWPMAPSRPMPSEAAIRKIDAFMKGGGTIIFDTRDALNNRGGNSVTPETQYMRRILASIDVPDLEPVPKDHVVTKTFYILENFVGRYAAGRTWIEVLQRNQEQDRTRPAQAGDRVSPIIITGNDLAAAWAVDRLGQPRFPLVPGDPRQREFAIRGGINIVMYALTGNYKADQVHVPALLERLGQ
ncbi:MAG: DUF4159 domain-containing protein [Methylocystis sp.]|nr:DUF4159 domain-containing protein [Methylocystis sp.]MCA3583164.1 DUF4159 domain-containing protein [Methylocystis sp.]MCA3587631.1 DUF4159 domain-containing protein [Methylocystis sp.]MCA3590758.1 DUF4159 domain-containing protein [Methylocystis sp.]